MHRPYSGVPQVSWCMRRLIFALVPLEACGFILWAGAQVFGGSSLDAVHPITLLPDTVYEPPTGLCLEGPPCPPPPDTHPPTAPGNLQGMATETTITLTWNASTDDTGVAGSVVARSGVPFPAQSGLQYQDSGLAPGSAPTHTRW